MRKRQHPFTPYFIISEEKANSTHLFHNEVTPEKYERILNLDSKFVQPLNYEDDGENSCSLSQSQISLLLKISKKQKLNNLTTQPIYKYD
ncbi:3928_t:CDS:2 [Dentiscutata heterogama]|uniref:3928_t:CDS:1 n=1 Tax=Dentiscutata heterogama TaxID=1316150 RepID=A0ACA9NFF3_9GLOM|nr:3928_t:CDS:2 [Dentiscutata heterogama]